MKRQILIPAIYASMQMACQINLQITNENNIEKKKRLIDNNDYKLEKPKSKYHK